MPKYKRKTPEIVEAVQYNHGMEDGVSAYKLTGEWIGWYDKFSPYPKTKLCPYIYDNHGDPVEFNWGDYLVTYENRSEQWVRQEDFERNYELAE